MDDDQMFLAVHAYYMRLKGEVDTMVAQGMSHKAITAALKRRVWQQRFAEELPADTMAYCIKLVLAWHRREGR
jgi:hypothetical protein